MGDLNWFLFKKVSPKVNGWYSCTVQLSESRVVMDLYYKNGKWLDNRRINMFDLYEIYGYGNSTEKHRLSYSEFDDFDWTDLVIAWKFLPDAYLGG